MKNVGEEFKKYALLDKGISSLHMESYIQNTTPYIVEERKLNVAQMDVFSRLMMDRIIFLGTGIDDQIANIIQAQLLFLESVDATICTGMAASMGAVLLCAGAAGKRSALKHSRVMIHQPLGGAQGQATDMEITLKEILKLKKELYDILATHSGQTFEQIEKDGERDYWMTSTEAKEYGVIDEVLLPRK